MIRQSLESPFNDHIEKVEVNINYPPFIVVSMTQIVKVRENDNAE